MATNISSQQLKDRFLLIYRENAPDTANPYSKIKVDNFVDKTGVGLAKQPSAAFPDGLAGTIIPVTGGGLVYSDISGKLSLDLPTDTLNFVGFIIEIDQKPDNGLQPGDFYIVNGEDITIKVSDWPGIDENITPVFTIAESKSGSGYRANTGTIDQLQGYDPNRPAGQPNDLTFDGEIIGGHLASVTLFNGGTGYQSDQVVEVLPGPSGGGGSGALVRITGVDSSGTVTSLEVYSPGNSFRLGPGAAGTLNPVLAEGGSGTGMRLTGDILEGTGAPANVVIVDEGYGYEDGDVLTLPGSTSTDNAEYTLSIAGNGDVSVNLGDRVFYKKDGTFVLVPDVVGTQAIMELLPDEVADKVPYFFKDNPDKQHLLLHINEAGIVDGNYQPGLISGIDKEKLDNIAFDAKQGRTWEINTDPESNYIDDSTSSIDGVNPLNISRYRMIDKTGDTYFEDDTYGYDINALNSQKILKDSAGNIISPRNRGVVFLAEREEIEDLIDITTLGGDVSPSTVMNAEDSIEYLTQRNFTTLPLYVQSDAGGIGVVEIVGNTDVLPTNNTILTARVTETQFTENQLEYTWTIGDANNIIDEQVIDGNTAYISIKENVVGQSATATVVVSTKEDLELTEQTDIATINVVSPVTAIGLVELTSPPSDFRGVAAVSVPFAVSIKGDDPTTDVEFVIDEDELAPEDYTIVHTPNTLSADITFNRPSTSDITDVSNNYKVEVRVYSENAIDATEVADDGRKYRSNVFTVLIDGSVIDPTITQVGDVDPAAGQSTDYRLTYDGEASSDDVEITFETDGTIQVISPNDDILNMFDGDDTTYTLVSTTTEVDFSLPGPLVSTDFSLMEFDVMSDTDTTLEVTHTDNNGQQSLLSTHTLTANTRVTIQAATGGTDDLGEMTLSSPTDVFVYKMTYDSNEVLKYASDEVVTVDEVATITFGAPGPRKITSSITYQGEVQHTDLDITVN